MAPVPERSVSEKLAELKALSGLGVHCSCEGCADNENGGCTCTGCDACDREMEINTENETVNQYGSDSDADGDND